MTKTQFIEKLGAELGIPTKHLIDSALLASFPAWDSMGKMAVVLMLDAELHHTMPTGALQACKTVSDLVATVESKLDQ